MDKCSERDLASAANRRPIGREPVETPPPAVYPGRIPLEGPRVRLEALDPRRHASELFGAGHADEEALRLWEYLPYGPFDSEAAMAAWIRGFAASADPVFAAIHDKAAGRVAGMASFLEIRPWRGTSSGIRLPWLAGCAATGARTRYARFR